MTLLYVCGTYTPAAGGAEISAAILMRHLARTCRIAVVTQARGSIPAGIERDGDVTIHRVADRDAAERLIATWLGAHPDAVVLTQNAWADLALAAAKRHGVRAVYFARAAGKHLNLLDRERYRCDLVISNSETVARFVRETWAIEAPVVRSPVEGDRYQLPRRNGSYITMVNPIALKGGFLVQAVAAILRDRAFLVVRGWNHLRRADGTWDARTLGELSRGLGHAGEWQPEEADFRACPNVRVCPGVAEMRDVYAQTRVLLVPSIVSESIPRVAVEALCSGVPVIGSRAGGIPEGLGGAGLIVDDFSNPHAWVAAIEEAERPAFLRRMAECAPEIIARHEPSAIARQVLSVLATSLPAA